MMHALVGTLALTLLSMGCATSMFGQRERVNPRHEVHVGAASGMEPTIRPAKGTGLVVGMRMAFDFGPTTSATKRADSKSKSVLALMGGRLNPVVQTPKPTANSSF